jgi:hypothetical protein
MSDQIGSVQIHCTGTCPACGAPAWANVTETGRSGDTVVAMPSGHCGGADEQGRGCGGWVQMTGSARVP